MRVLRVQGGAMRWKVGAGLFLGGAVAGFAVGRAVADPRADVGAAEVKPPPSVEPRLGRMKVEGGWIYRVEGQSGICFVPEGGR